MDGSRIKNGFTQSALNLLMVGVLLYVAGFYMLPSSKQNTLFYLTVLLPWVLLLPFMLKELPIRHIIAKLLLICAVYFCLSSFWSSDPGLAVPIAAKYSLYIFAYMTSIYLLMKNKKLSIEIVLKIIVIAAIVSGGLTLIELWPLVSSRRLVHSTVIGISTNPINTAVFYGIATLTTIYLICRKNSVIYNIVLILALCLFTVIIIQTMSRGPVIALILVLPLMFFLVKNHFGLKGYLILSVAVISVAIISIGLFEPVIERLKAPNHRLEIWTASFEKICQNFLFGTGLNYEDRIVVATGRAFTHSHNSFIQSILTGGIVGISLLMSIVAFAFIVGLRNQNAAVRFCVLWLLFGCLCLSTNGKILLYRPSSIWFSFWVPLSLILSSHFIALNGSKYDYFSKLKHHYIGRKVIVKLDGVLM